MEGRGKTAGLRWWAPMDPLTCLWVIGSTAQAKIRINQARSFS